jgi:hypothetical protein
VFEDQVKTGSDSRYRFNDDARRLDHASTNLSAVPEYDKAMRDTLGENGLASLQAAADRHVNAMQQSAVQLYRNFMKMV